MARSRSIKPALFDNELLGEADPILTLLFVGLWTLADREGRLEDRPKRIRAKLFPYRDGVDVDALLDELARLRLIARLERAGRPVIEFDEQAGDECFAADVSGFFDRDAAWNETRARVFARDEWTCRYCGATDVPLQCDHIVPRAKGGPDTDGNLIAACQPCNASKGSKDLLEWLAGREAPCWDELVPMAYLIAQSAQGGIQ